MRLPETVLDRWIPALGAFLLRALGKTLRVRLEGDETLRALHAAGRPAIMASYHNTLIVGLEALRSYRPVIAVSHSRDGERIAGMVEKLDWETTRGSSSRGGVRALLSLVRALSDGRIVAHLVDGPRGPAGEIKPGLMLLAQRSGAPILLVYVSSRPRIRAPSWDRMQIPLPFARVVLRFEEPVYVAPDLSAEQVESLRRELEKRLAEGFERIDREMHGQ